MEKNKEINIPTLDDIKNISSEELKEIESKELNNDPYEIDEDKFAKIGDSLSLLIRDISLYPVLPWEEQLQLFDRLKSGDEKAKNEIFLSNVRLVLKLSYYFRNRGLGVEELFQEGCIGLLKAIEGFDSSLGFRFSTYATWWIKKTTKRAIADKGTTIRIPVHMNETFYKIRQWIKKAVEDNNIEPTIDEITKQFELSADAKRAVMRYLNTSSLASLNQIIKAGDDNNTEIGDFLKDEKSENGYDKFENKVDDEIILYKCKKVLNPKEYYIIYFRVLADERKTLEDLGEEFGVTRERIRQIEQKCLTRMGRILKTSNFSNKFEVDYNELSNTNLRPYPISTVIKCFYFESHYSFQEYIIFYEYFFGNSYHNIEHISQELGISIEDVEILVDDFNNKLLELDDKKSEIFIKTKEKYLLNNGFYSLLVSDIGKERVESYLKYRKIDRTKLLKQIIDESNYDNLLFLIRTHNIEISPELNDIIISMFNADECSINDATNEINILLNGLHYTSNTLPAKELKNFYYNNIHLFNEEEEKIIEGNIINTISRLDYQDVKTVLHKIETEYFRGNVMGIPTSELMKSFKYAKPEELQLLKEVYYEKKSISEIAVAKKVTQNAISASLNYILYKIILTHYGYIFEEEDIDKDIYREILLDDKNKFETTSRQILIKSLLENKSFEEIAALFKDNIISVKAKYSNALRRLELYRLGLKKEFEISEKEVLEIIKSCPKQFSDADERMLIDKYSHQMSFEELKRKHHYHSAQLCKVANKFIAYYYSKHSKPITIEEVKQGLIENDILYDKQEKSIISYLFGIANEYNPKGILLSGNELIKKYNISTKELLNVLNLTDRIKFKKIKDNNDVLCLLSTADVNKVLNDPKAPFTLEERKLLSKIYGIYPYAKLNIQFLMDSENITKTTALRRVEDLNIKAKRYLNKEVLPKHLFDMTIKPLLRYFSMYNRKIVQDIFSREMSIQEIATKYNIAVTEATSLYYKLSLEVELMVLKKCDMNNQIDYDMVLHNGELLPINVGGAKAIEIFNKITGNDGNHPCSLGNISKEEKLSVAEVMFYYEEVCNAVKKYQMGITNNFLSDETLNSTIARDSKEMDAHTLIRYKNALSVKDKVDVSNFVKNDIIKRNNLASINLNCASKKDIEDILNIYGCYLSLETKNYLINSFEILPKVYLSPQIQVEIEKLVERLQEWNTNSMLNLRKK